MSEAVNSVKVFESYNKLWHFLGLNFEKKPRLAWAMDIFVTITVTFYYPLHLIIGVLLMRNMKDVFSNLLITVACFICSVKQFLYRPQFGNMREITKLFEQLDLRVRSKDEQHFHENNIRKTSEVLFKVYMCAYNSVGVMSILMTLASNLLSDQRILVYPAWFPFDWRSSFTLFFFAALYQIFGIFMQIQQNIASDSYPPIALCLLSGHLRLLSMRLSKVGYDKEKSEDHHYKDLVESITDYVSLMRIFQRLQETISWNMLIQSATNGLNTCFCLIYLVFYANQLFEYVYATLLMLGVAFEFYPCCYYGSIVELNFHDLTYAIFKSNWQDRTKDFRQTVRILSEFSLKPVTMYAKNMVKVHLDTYFATIRVAYSFFCVILNYKN